MSALTKVYDSEQTLVNQSKTKIVILNTSKESLEGGFKILFRKGKVKITIA
jgi:hypothetical protein